MKQVRFDRVSKAFGDVEVLKELDLVIEPGEFVALLGPSGCGKTTALRCLAGLETPATGRVFIGERDVTRLSPAARDIAMVFQTYALYPHLKVRDNIAYPLRVRGTAREAREKLVRSAAEMLDIGACLDRRPGQLSGGQRQRVALARAIVRRPQVFLMDEPLSNLDAQLRLQMRAELKHLQKHLGVTALYVTHDQAEATTMADRVAVMRAGRLEQIGSPRDLYALPATEFVASFVGSPPMNLVDVQTTESGVSWAGSHVPLPPSARQAAHVSRELRLGFRAEDVCLTEPGVGHLDAEVFAVQPMDAETIVTFRHGSVEVTGRFGLDVPAVMGSTVGLRLREDRLHGFSATTGQRIFTTNRSEFASEVDDMAGSQISEVGAGPRLRSKGTPERDDHSHGPGGPTPIEGAQGEAPRGTV